MHNVIARLDLLESEVLGSSGPLDPLQRRREPVWALGIRNVEHLLQTTPECHPLQTQSRHILVWKQEREAGLC